MHPLFYAVLGVALAATAVTLYAFASATDGYEDEDGFHVIQSKTKRPRRRNPSVILTDESDTAVNPYAPHHPG
jgi:hypothetical protein